MSIPPGPSSGPPLRTVSLKDRCHLVHAHQLGDPSRHAGLHDFVQSLPDLLAGRALKALVAAVRKGRLSGRKLIWGLGGHVVKSGVTPYLVALMERGFVNHIAVNGAFIIHDFELAFCGETSEVVADSLRDGSFGMARETGEILGSLMCSPEARSCGIAAHVGEALQGSEYPHRSLSLLAHAHRLSVPVSVHMALGTDVVHYHPTFDWGAAGAAARRDFDRFLDAVAGLDGGGVYLNVGSAVVLPEVFLKAVSLTRNRGGALAGFTTVVLDMIDHYRPRENVLKRPGGTGLQILGHHEILIPLIAGALLEQP